MVAGQRREGLGKHTYPAGVVLGTDTSHPVSTAAVNTAPAVGTAPAGSTVPAEHTAPAVETAAAAAAVGIDSTAVVVAAAAVAAFAGLETVSAGPTALPSEPSLMGLNRTENNSKEADLKRLDSHLRGTISM